MGVVISLLRQVVSDKTDGVWQVIQEESGEKRRSFMCVAMFLHGRSGNLVSSTCWTTNVILEWLIIHFYSFHHPDVLLNLNCISLWFLHCCIKCSMEKGVLLEVGGGTCTELPDWHVPPWPSQPGYVPKDDYTHPCVQNIWFCLLTYIKKNKYIMKKIPLPRSRLEISAAMMK